MSQLSSRLIAGHQGDSGFKMISVGTQGLSARLDLINAARKSIDIQSYIFRDDISGGLVASALLQAAGRGVRVRIMVDDGETVPGDEKLLSLSASPGFEVRIFNPLTYRGHNRIRRGVEFLFNKARLDYRMHNKLMIVDSAVVIAGGRNIGDQYFQIDPESQFGDDDVIAVGPVVSQLIKVFNLFWNSPEAVPAAAIDKRHTNDHALQAFLAELAHKPGDLKMHSDADQGRRPVQDLLADRLTLAWAPVKVIYDSPDKKDVDRGEQPGRLIYKAVAGEARAATTEFMMVTAYFIPSKDELAVITSQRKRGVRVRVLTNSLEAAPSAEAHSGYMHYRVPLLQQGVELHEIRALLGSTTGSGQGEQISRHGNYALHAKLFVFDRQRLFVGSMNFDERSRHLNTEIGLLIDSSELSGQVVARFEQLTGLENSYALSLSDGNSRPLWTTLESRTVTRYRVEPARSVWQRAKVRVLSWLPLDREL